MITELHQTSDMTREADALWSDPDTRATLLGWAVGQIEAQGYWRDVWSEQDGIEIHVSRVDNAAFERWGRAPTELEATLISLAEILEAQR